MAAVGLRDDVMDREHLWRALASRYRWRLPAECCVLECIGGQIRAAHGESLSADTPLLSASSRRHTGQDYGPT